MNQLQIAALCALFSLSLSPVASAVALDGKLTITPGVTGTDANDNPTYMGGSYFKFGAAAVIGGSFVSAVTLSPGSDGGIVLGQYQRFVLDPDVPHPQGWQGDTNGDGIADGSAGAGYGATTVSGGGDIVAAFQFFGNDTYLGTNPVSYQSGLAHPAPTADITDCVGNICTLSLQAEAWEVMWNGSAFEQGPRPVNTGPFTLATGTYDLSDNSYSVTWASQINQGPFNGVTGRWHLEGTVVAVPEPASSGMMAAGLLMLGGAWRLKKQRSV
jgi:hypothetical protein